MGIHAIPFTDIPVKSPDAAPMDFCAFDLLKSAVAKHRPHYKRHMENLPAAVFNIGYECSAFCTPAVETKMACHMQSPRATYRATVANESTSQLSK